MDYIATIEKILRKEAKRTTYKIALVRAIKDIALEYSHLNTNLGEINRIAIPLKLIAEHWLTYYWAFVDIRQGYDNPDMTFREDLTHFRRNWELNGGANHHHEGYLVKKLLNDKPTHLVDEYNSTLETIQKGVEQPIRFSGTGEYTLFDKPEKFSDLSDVISIPMTEKDDACLVIDIKLWKMLQKKSDWIEESCVDEWCLFTERLQQSNGQIQTYADTYRLLKYSLDKS